MYILSISTAWQVIFRLYYTVMSPQPHDAVQWRCHTKNQGNYTKNFKKTQNKQNYNITLMLIDYIILSNT